MNYRGWFKITTKNGTWVIKNQETDVLRARTVQAWNGVALSPFVYLAIGTDDTIPDPTQTALFAEVLRFFAGSAIEQTAVTGDTLHLTIQFVAAIAMSIFELGVFDAAVGGNMAARAVHIDENGDSSAFNIGVGEGITLEYFLQAL
jgi:hypothetical protein